MVVRIQLTVKHIRCHTFPIDADVESDVLGLKVLIWESQKIAIENQRLVFGGKELEDNLKLNELGIGDNAMIFLVESNSEVPQQPQAELTPVKVPIITQPQVTVPPCTTQTQQSSCSYNNNSCAYKCPYQQRQQQQQQPQTGEVYYEQFDEDTVVSEERITGVVNLSYWVRKYCILGMIVSAFSIVSCLYCIIPFLIYTLGFIGSRTLNRCLLFFPLLMTILLGFGLSSMSIYWLIAFHEAYLAIFLFIGLLHIVIFFCMCKLMCRIGHLTCQEWWQARLRIRSSCCCRRP